MTWERSRERHREGRSSTATSVPNPTHLSCWWYWMFLILPLPEATEEIISHQNNTGAWRLAGYHVAMWWQHEGPVVFMWQTSIFLSNRFKYPFKRWDAIWGSVVLCSSAAVYWLFSFFIIIESVDYSIDSCLRWMVLLIKVFGKKSTILSSRSWHVQLFVINTVTKPQPYVSISCIRRWN